VLEFYLFMVFPGRPTSLANWECVFHAIRALFVRKQRFPKFWKGLF